MRKVIEVIKNKIQLFRRDGLRKKGNFTISPVSELNQLPFFVERGMKERTN